GGVPRQRPDRLRQPADHQAQRPLAVGLRPQPRHAGARGRTGAHRPAHRHHGRHRHLPHPAAFRDPPRWPAGGPRQPVAEAILTMAVSHHEASRLLRRATLASVCVALTLITAKALVWWLSGSVALLASLMDSLMDGAASLVTLLAVRYSLQPADAEHRFGHGKAEALAGL